MDDPALELRCVNALRFLAVDMVERAKSGHPGLPLGAAPMAYVLWTRHLRYHPKDPTWADRDRFVLSAGHGSALLYALLHATGYDLPLSELQRFRQVGSLTPGHPEYRLTPGVEATTGPLGQGFAMGVGMAIAERYLAHLFNRDGFPVVDHRTYSLVSDGDLMEGIASEAASVAGTMGLGRLVYLYDSNHVSLEGGTNLAFTEDVAARFSAYGWNVARVPDGNDLDAIDRAITSARSQDSRPSLILVTTHIGYGSPKQDTYEAHGEPLGPAATVQTKTKLGWPLEPPFLVPPDVAAAFSAATPKCDALVRSWREMFERYRAQYPDLAQQFERAIRGELPDGWEGALPTFVPTDGPMATRDASSKALQAIAAKIPTLLGGSADLTPSTRTALPGQGDFGIGGGRGRNLHFGVRENAMVAMLNGLAVHGGVRPYGATFLTFSDYAKPALRIAALMGVPTIVVFTHDSIALGEDGPTHQPIEHLWALRATPHLTVVRPADANEASVAWRVALTRNGPVLLVLTRQKLPILGPAPPDLADSVARGAYVLREATGGRPKVVLVGSGSEVALLVAARERLESIGAPTRVVSVPSTELFDEQPESYRSAVIPPGVPALAVEAGATVGWWKYVGAHGDVLGIDRFGASGPGPEVLAKFGFTAEAVVRRAGALVARTEAAS